VSADVFATQQQLALTVHEHGGVYRAGVLAKRLKCSDALTQAIEPFGGRQGRAGQHLEIGQCLFHRFHAAKAATAGASHLPTLLLEVPEGAVGDGHLRVLR
jgi:hypothetical protein